MLEYESKYLLDNFDNVCRFCLSQDNCTEILSNGIISENLEKAIDFIVTRVDENDGLPNKICKKCVHCITEYAELEQRCQEAYEVLQQVSEQAIDTQSNAEILCEDATVDEAKPSIHEIDAADETEQPSVETFYVDEHEWIEPETLDDPESLKSPAQRKGKNCPICGKFVSQLSKHLPMHSDVKRHICSFCNKKFAHDTTLRKHVNSVHLKIKKYQCKRCQESFTDPSSLRYHNVTKHQGTKYFTCTICSKSYYTSTGLQQHNSLNHEQRKFKCEECGKMFALKYHLKEHEKTHSDVRPYACGLCDKTFKRSKNLNEHHAVHKDDVGLDA